METPLFPWLSVHTLPFSLVVRTIPPQRKNAISGLLSAEKYLDVRPASIYKQLVPIIYAITAVGLNPLGPALVLPLLPPRR